MTAASFSVNYCTERQGLAPGCMNPYGFCIFPARTVERGNIIFSYSHNLRKSILAELYAYVRVSYSN